MDHTIINKYFPNLTPLQKEQFLALQTLYNDWNAKINVISRKDIDNLYLHHVLHSLSLASFLGEIKPGTGFVDIGTGGGFPAIPMSIMYPEARFHLVDRINKKLKVASNIGEAIGLRNLTFQHGDMAECKDKYDYAVSRAVMPLNELVKICRKNIKPVSVNRYANGLLCLKGGNLENEMQGINFPVMEYPITDFINEPFFETKNIVYVPIK